MNIIKEIEPKMLHKHLSDDVLISDPKMLMPISFELNKKLSSEKIEKKIKSLYVEKSERNYRFKRIEIGKGVAGIPFSDILDDDEKIKGRGIPYDVAEIVRDCLNEDIYEEGIDVNEILEEIGLKKKSTGFRFINKADHYFFYRKSHEHVPGIMLLEAARQAIYYQLYSSSEYKPGEVTVSLSELNAKFYAYAELMYPIEVVVDDLTEGDISRPKKLRYCISFFQNGYLIAEVESIAPVIGINKFKKARNACLIKNEVFYPLLKAKLVNVVSINEKKYLVNLEEISKEYCLISGLDEFGDGSIDLSIIYENSICFTSKVKKILHKDGLFLLKFENSEYMQIENMKEIIKRGFAKKSNPKQDIFLNSYDYEIQESAEVY